MSFRGPLRPQMTRYGLHARRVAKRPSTPGKLRQLRCLRCRFDCYRVERTSSRGRDRAEARALGHGRHSHVSSGPPAIPEGRISRFRFWPWLFPRGLSKIGEAQALARIHPTYVGLPLDSSFQSWLLRLTPLAIRGPPSAQSSFACHKCDSWKSGVQRHLEERYPFFIAPTSSSAKPASSSGLRVSTLISRGSGRLLRAPAGNWFFPTLSLQVFPRMLEPLIPSGGRVHLPVTFP